jgi:Protein of unknown function (DUF3606)
MANTKKQTGRGRKQDRARVAGGQDYEVRYEAKKTRRSAGSAKKAVKKVGNSRKRVENRLGTLTSSRWFVRRRRHLRSYLHSVRFGAVRTLILMRRHIFKFPGRWKWDSRNWWWDFLLRGLLSNLQEKRFAATGWPELCPVAFSLPGGLLIVMPRATPLTDAEWKHLDYRAFVTRGEGYAEDNFDAWAGSWHQGDGGQ